MSYGIQVSNSDGDIQIDSQYRNFSIRFFGVVSTSFYSETGAIFANIPNVQLSSRTPLVMIRASGSQAVGAVVDNLQEAPSGFLVYSYPYNTVKYAVLDLFDILDTSNDFGLQVYSPSGLTVFKSSWKHFFVDYVVTITSSSNYSSHIINLPLPEFGERYFQAIVRGGGGEYGQDPGVTVTRLSETQFKVECLGLAYPTSGGGFAPIQVSFLTGYFLA